MASGVRPSPPRAPADLERADAVCPLSARQDVPQGHAGLNPRGPSSGHWLLGPALQRRARGTYVGWDAVVDRLRLLAEGWSRARERTRRASKITVPVTPAYHSFTTSSPRLLLPRT